MQTGDERWQGPSDLEGLPDEELMDLVRDRPPAAGGVHSWAFGILVRRYDRRLAAKAEKAGLQRVDVDNCRQKVWLRIGKNRAKWHSEAKYEKCRNAGRYTRPRSFSGWLFAIAENMIADILRSYAKYLVPQPDEEEREDGWLERHAYERCLSLTGAKAMAFAEILVLVCRQRAPRDRAVVRQRYFSFSDWPDEANLCRELGSLLAADGPAPLPSPTFAEALCAAFGERKCRTLFKDIAFQGVTIALAVAHSICAKYIADVRQEFSK